MVTFLSVSASAFVFYFNERMNNMIETSDKHYV